MLFLGQPFKQNIYVDKLHHFVQSGRQLGKTDEQIRQALFASGWSPEQIAPAFVDVPYAQPSAPLPNPGNSPQHILNVQTSTPGVPINRRRYIPGSVKRQYDTFKVAANPTKAQKKPILMIGFSLIIILVVAGSFLLFIHKPTYQSVIQQFITTVQNKDKKTADSLESPALKAYGLKYARTSSFYDACQISGQFCTPIFSKSFIGKSTKFFKPYKSSNGTIGKEIMYTEAQTASGIQAGGKGCSSSSTSKLTIAVIPNGISWLIDFVDPSISFNAKLC